MTKVEKAQWTGSLFQHYNHHPKPHAEKLKQSNCSGGLFLVSLSLRAAGLSWRGGKYPQPALMDAISRKKKSTGLLSRNRKRNIETGARASMRGKLVFFGHFFHTKFLLFLTQHRETSKGFYLIFLFWCTFSVCKVVPLLSKVYLKRNPFNYRAQIAAVFFCHIYSFATIKP